MNLIFWIFVLLGSVWVVHWGADKIAEPLKKLRQQWGLTESAGAAFVALATASPEVAINATSALQGVSDIGLGNLLGSNIISFPAIVTVAYLGAQNHLRTHLLERITVQAEAFKTQNLPYIAIVFLAAILALPKPWRGLQPIDGWIMLGSYLIYAVYAIWRKHQRGERVKWQFLEIIISILGPIGLIFGAYFTVTATDKIVDILKISNLLGGLFITSTFSIAPEVFAAWSVARSGQITTASTSVIKVLTFDAIYLVYLVVIIQIILSQR